MKRVIMRKVALAISLATIATSPVSASDPVDDSLRHFAEAHGITFKEAATDYKKQLLLAQATGEAMEELGDRYPGHTVTKEPMVARVRMTGVDRLASRRVSTEVGELTVIFVPGAPVGIKALESVVRSGALDGMVPGASRYHVDVQSGAVVIKVVGEENFRAAKAEESSLSKAFGVPIRIEFVKTRMRNLSHGSSRGGSRDPNLQAACTFVFLPMRQAKWDSAPSDPGSIPCSPAWNKPWARRRKVEEVRGLHGCLVL